MSNENKENISFLIRNHADIEGFSSVLEEHGLLEFRNSLDVLEFISRDEGFLTDEGVVLNDLEKLVNEEPFFVNSKNQDYTYSVLRKAIHQLIDSKFVVNLADKKNICLALEPKLRYLFEV